jgi:hypothetical protein
MSTSLSRLGAVALLATLAGCASNTPHLDSQFGLAARSTLNQQIVHPGPPATQTVSGMDGQAAKSAYDNYQKSFKEPVPQAGALAIGIGR